MGASSDKKKYFNAYRSIKCVIDLTHNITTTVDNIYFVNVKTIKNYLEILNKYNILNMIIDIYKKSELKNLEDKIYNAFGDYKLEKGIEIFDINAKNIVENKFGDKEFILVDKDFLSNMNVNNKTYEDKQHSIIVKKNERHIKLKDDNGEKIIVNLIEVENKIGIYKFKTEESIEFNGESMAQDVKNEIEQNKEDEEDPEVETFRIKLKKKVEETKDITTEQKIEDNNNRAQINNQNNPINNENPPEIKAKRAPSAKLDEIVYSIYFSLSNNIEKDKIFEKIKSKITELKMQNELEETTDINIIGNIETSVIYLIDNFGLGNQNLININQSNNSNYYYQELSNLIDESDENSSLIQSRNIENNPHDNNHKFNPFEFQIMKYINCEKCNNEGNQEFVDEYRKININDECNNIDDCFKLSNLEKCPNHNIDAKCYFKFKTTPEILILKFENPIKSKKYIKFNEKEKNIDLKNHMHLSNNFNIKYELIKVFYVFDDSNDKKLYVDVSENESNNYIPYIIFYKKINDM